MELSLDLSKRYTYADYLTWVDDKARELIDGIIKMMPSPRSVHAKVSRKLVKYLDKYLDDTNCKCEIYNAPFDVRLPKNGETAHDKIYTVVQPDICVICDPSKVDELGCCGAPDMIIEILSPSSTKIDAYYKFGLYQKAGVKEYWIADPKAKAINVFQLQDNGEYDDGTVYETLGDKVPVHVFGGYLIELNDIFANL
jgi:Uma2 family endonuclease